MTKEHVADKVTEWFRPVVLSIWKWLRLTCDRNSGCMRNTATCVICVEGTGVMVVRIYEHCAV
jgi:hypothetical protein